MRDLSRNEGRKRMKRVKRSTRIESCSYGLCPPSITYSSSYTDQRQKAMIMMMATQMEK
jgi:hypothetical protein